VNGGGEFSDIMWEVESCDPIVNCGEKTTTAMGCTGGMGIHR